MRNKKAKCYVYCRPCEFFGMCPHSFKEYDHFKARMENKTEKEKEKVKNEDN